MLVSLTLALALSATDAPPLQLMKGPRFDALLRSLAHTCPGSAEPVRYTFPAQLADVEDGVIKSLSPARQSKVEKTVARANCGDGAACPTGASLDAIFAVGAQGRLVKAVCDKPQQYWR